MTNEHPLSALDLPPWPEVDHAAFGEVETQKLSRLQQFTGKFMARNWLMIPHVTHHDEVNITALETFREEINTAAARKVTLLPFLVRALVDTLMEFPRFNASLLADGSQIVLKKYFHIGIAVDTPNGLLVPVIRDCDSKSVVALQNEIAELSEKAKDKGLSMAEMSGGCCTISTLGGIGGTAFTPIINAPEVAILGVSKAQWKPQRGDADAVEWRLMLPLSLSYDHRVINGADAARFVARLGALLAEEDNFRLWDG